MATFTGDNWYPPLDARALTRFVQRAADVPGGVIELGSHEGRSALVLREACPERPILCVDAWPRPDIYQRFLSNVEGLNITGVQMTWDEFRAEPLEDLGPVAIVHIDMDHTYEQASDQIGWAQHLLPPGGMMVGHDYERIAWPDVIRAVDTCLVGREVEAHVWAWQQP